MQRLQTLGLDAFGDRSREHRSFEAVRHPKAHETFAATHDVAALRQPPSARANQPAGGKVGWIDRRTLPHSRLFASGRRSRRADWRPTSFRYGALGAKRLTATGNGSQVSLRSRSTRCYKHHRAFAIFFIGPVEVDCDVQDEVTHH